MTPAQHEPDPDRQERWILVRGDREPCVYPFDNQEAAQDFALDHGMLDWRAERNDDPKKPHEEICGSCREPWPCKVVRLDREASAIIWQAKHACQRCKKSAGWHVKVPGGGDLGDDAIYHARKGPCRTMARKELARLGHDDLLAKFDAQIRENDERNARTRAWRAAHKEAVANGLRGQELSRYRIDALARYEAQQGAA